MKIDTFKQQWADYRARTMLKFDLTDHLIEIKSPTLYIDGIYEFPAPLHISFEKKRNINYIYFRNISRRAGKTTALIEFAQFLKRDVLYIAINSYQESEIRERCRKYPEVVIGRSNNMFSYLHGKWYTNILIDDARDNKNGIQEIKHQLEKTIYKNMSMNVVFMDA